MTPNHLYYGDNLTILRERIPAESVDLIYLDPPFNSNRSYNVLFRSRQGDDSEAQIQAFDDTWHWSQQTEAQFLALLGGEGSPRVADALTAMRNLLGTSDANAYLVMMAARLVELHRVLKPTGTVYLHCDPTAGHYLKILLDAVFGVENYLNEIIWHYQTSSGAPRKWLIRNHDLIFRYAKDDVASVTWHHPKSPWPESTLRKWQRDEEGRIYRVQNRFNKRYYIDPEGKLDDDVWEITLSSRSHERLGYPTQKPLALLERIIQASSNPGDVVLDPFCGCGTTIDAAQKLDRRWIGIDITYLAVDLIRKRLRGAYGDKIELTYKVHGVPADTDGAAALFAENPFDFERWAVSLIDAQPNQKQVGDKGIDGRVRFHADEGRIGQALVSVKGGQTVGPTAARDLRGTVEREGAEMGILITLAAATRGVREEADKSGSYEAGLTGQTYPRIQVVTVADLMGGKRPEMPTAILPYLKAKPRDPDQLTLDGAQPQTDPLPTIGRGRIGATVGRAPADRGGWFVMTLGYDVQADRHVGLVWGFAYGVTLDAEGSDRALCAAQGLPHPNLLTD